MRLATWNINGTRARLDLVKLWLKDRQPDIVGFQELKMEDSKFPSEELESLGYYVLTHGQKSWNGVAILSREPGKLVQAGLPGQEDMGARLLTAEVFGIDFTTVYIPNGKTVEHEDFPKKLAWLEALAAHLRDRKVGSRASVVVGDFNICPAPIDSWSEELLNGHIFHTGEERSRFQALLDLGLIDLFRDLYPDEALFSWWDYRGGAFHRRQGLRIDLVLGSAAVRKRTRAVTIDREWRKKQEGLTPSDHAPVLLELD